MNTEALVKKLEGSGNDAFISGNYKKAADFCSQAIEVDPKSYILFSKRSVYFSCLEKYVDALKDAETSIKLNPNWAQVLSRRMITERDILGKGLHLRDLVEPAMRLRRTNKP